MIRFMEVVFGPYGKYTQNRALKQYRRPFYMLMLRQTVPLCGRAGDACLLDAARYGRQLLLAAFLIEVKGEGGGGGGVADVGFFLRTLHAGGAYDIPMMCVSFTGGVCRMPMCGRLRMFGMECADCCQVCR